MTQIALKIITFGILTTLTACLQEDLVPSSKTMRLFSIGNEVAVNESANKKAVLLFYEYDHFPDITKHLPLLVSKPDGDINSYSERPYDTHTFYPPKDNIVTVVGYSPQDLTPSKDFGTLSLTTNKSGATTDFLTSIQPIYGSASNPFNGQTPLRFMHAQSKVTFKAILDQSMPLHIRKVQVKIGSESLTGSMIWDKVEKQFVAQKAVAETIFSFGQTDNTPLSKTDTVTIGSVYVLPKLTKIPVEITAEGSDNQNFSPILNAEFFEDLMYTISRDPNKDEDKGKTENTLYAGEAYVFTLKFSQSNLILTGTKEPWENGGEIGIPLFPNGEEVKP